MVVGQEDGRIMAAYLMNHEADPAYERAHWQAQAEREEVAVLHALRVDPAYGGRGFA